MTRVKHDCCQNDCCQKDKNKKVWGKVGAAVLWGSYRGCRIGRFVQRTIVELD